MFDRDYEIARQKLAQLNVERASTAEVESWARKHPREAKHIRAIARGLAPSIKHFVNAKVEAATAPLIARIAELEAREMKYCGTWRAGTGYRRGSVVTDHGSAWHCNAIDTTRRPGAGNRDWVLMVKRGSTRGDRE